MATVASVQDGAVMVTLDAVEQDTVAGLPQGQLQAYITMWLKERATSLFQEQFSKLSDQDKTDVLKKFRDAGKVTP